MQISDQIDAKPIADQIHANHRQNKCKSQIKLMQITDQVNVNHRENECK